jgi:hypothetical protein
MAMQQQIEMFAKQIDQEIEVLLKEGLQCFARSTKPEMTVKGVSKRKGKEV